ncbi:MAG: phosphoribosylglycinamide formyltransferase [bacterium]|nr:phosphoribosylglycinamide formyltransferase [bacterium]
MTPKIIIFASGAGSNAINIIHYFNLHPEANVAAIFTNKKDAGVVPKAIENRIALQYFNKSDFYDSNRVVELANQYQPDLIVLAGFLWLVPASFINAFENKIINLHPALLPKYGGKGMYGHFVHEAVVQNKEIETGITIHKVNTEFDKGEIIFQAKCRVTEEDSADSVAKKIHFLEHQHLPSVIAEYLKKQCASL